MGCFGKCFHHLQQQKEEQGKEWSSWLSVDSLIIGCGEMGSFTIAIIQGFIIMEGPAKFHEYNNNRLQNRKNFRNYVGKPQELWPKKPEASCYSLTDFWNFLLSCSHHPTPFPVLLTNDKLYFLPSAQL